MKEKQIEEMAKTMCPNYGEDKCRTLCAARKGCFVRNGAEILYEAGYRKPTEGEWIVCGMFDDFFKCSSCGDKHPWQTAIEYKYCPNCGAKMKGV